MTSRRVLIGIGLLTVMYNILRAFHRWRFAPAFGAGSVVQLLGLVIVFGVAFLVAEAAWKRSDSLPMLPSALWGALSGAVVGLLATYISTINEQTYGLALFLLAPVLVGFHSAFALAARERVRLRDAVTVSIFAIVLLGMLLIGFALEGAVCLLMALPIAIPLAIVGALLAYGLRKYAFTHQPTVLLLFMGLTPFSAIIEHQLPKRADIVQVATSIDIRASPQQVWQTILQPSRLAAPSQLVFRAGVAYPLASHIEGTGASAIRYCDFSTGKLIEPVLIWDEGKRLRFTVRSNPLPMQEWTPYARLHPPHLDGFLNSRQGEFLIEALPDGTTRLTATTWYQDHLYPAQYWKLWSDHIIHQVHHMVLENVRERALANLQKYSPLEESHGLAAHRDAVAAVFAP